MSAIIILVILCKIDIILKGKLLAQFQVLSALLQIFYPVCRYIPPSPFRSSLTKFSVPLVYKGTFSYTLELLPGQLILPLEAWIFLVPPELP